MSGTFTNNVQRNAFLQMLNNSPNETRLLILHQADYIRKTYPEFRELGDIMLTRDLKLLMELGIPLENISTFDLVSEGKPDIESYDVLFVEGGNSFYYLYRMRENGIWEDVRKFIERGGLYVGISAGSLIMSPSVDENFTREKNFGLEDVSAFGYVDFYLIVHWDSFFKGRHTFSLKYSWVSGKKVVPLTDQQSVLVTDEGFTIISPDQ